MTYALGRGSVDVPADRVVAVVARRLGLGEHGVTLAEDQIVWQLRMPRVLAAAACGTVLALVGAVLQSLTRNDLADPYLLGISGGAAVGAVSVIVLGIGVGGLVGSAALALASFLGALGALVLVLLLAVGRGGTLDPTRTVLAGVAVGQAAAAYTSFLVMVHGDSHSADRVMRWTLGSIARVRTDDVAVLVGTALVTVVVVLACAGSLDAFAFGETGARSLGVDVTRLRWLLLAGSALVVSVLVAHVGAIGFVGLVVPHVARMVVGPGHRALLPTTAVAGAVLLVWADTGARTLVDGTEIPISVVTGIVGTPLFVWLLHRSRRRSMA
ncbi:FecCD family ABC transporter permease [Nocardioides imazamoxiresistens]